MKRTAPEGAAGASCVLEFRSLPRLVADLIERFACPLSLIEQFGRCPKRVLKHGIARAAAAVIVNRSLSAVRTPSSCVSRALSTSSRSSTY